MDEQVRNRVFKHILDWCGAKAAALPAEFECLPPKEQTLEVLRAALIARLGEKDGLKAFANLDGSL